MSPRCPSSKPPKRRLAFWPNLLDVGQRDAALVGALDGPVAAVGREWSYFTLGAAGHLERIGGAHRGAQPAAHAPGRVHDADVIGHGQRTELALLNAITAAGTEICVGDSAKIGMGDSGKDPELGDAPQYAARTGAAVTNVVVVVAIVASSVHQTRPLGLEQDVQRFLFGDSAIHSTVVKGPFNRCEDQAILHRVVATLADEALLDAADAVACRPRPGPFQQCGGTFIGKDL